MRHLRRTVGEPRQWRFGRSMPAKNWMVKIPTNLGVRTSTYSLSNLGGYTLWPA